MSSVKPSLVPSIDDLIRRYNLIDDCVVGEVHRKHMFTLSLSLDHWREVALCLGLTTPEIEEIEHDSKTEPEKRFKALKRWSNKHGPNAKYRLLLEAFLEIDRSDLAEQVCKMLGNVHPKTGCGKFRMLLILKFNCYSNYK